MPRDNSIPRIDLNPSSAERWTRCTASPRFAFDNWDKLPKSDTFFNQEGTTAHEVAASYLQGRKPDPANCPVPVDGDMQWHGWGYDEYVQSLLKPEGKLLVEQKLPLFYQPGRNAIVDAAVINPNEIHIIDYKYGEGITVDPENNLQGIIYAGCLQFENKVLGTPLPPVTIHIYQPRSRDRGSDPFRTWTISWDDLYQKRTEIQAVAARILWNAEHRKTTPEVVFDPSDKACQWCPAKGFCDARRQGLTKEIEVLATIEPGPKSLPPASTISVRQLQAVLEHGSEIIKWIGDAQGYALDYMKSGNKIEGFKLVLSRGGNRYWSDSKQAAKLLLDTTVLTDKEVYVQNVIGPATAEKLLGKHGLSAELTNLITKAPGVPCIAPATDKREEYGADLGNEFLNLDPF